MKKPFYKSLSKKNDIRPFDDVNSLEFLSKKNDCSLFVIGSHSKKRPNNLVMGRFFNYQLLDMVELGVLNYQSMDSFKSMKVPFRKPCYHRVKWVKSRCFSSRAICGSIRSATSSSKTSFSTFSAVRK